MGLWNETREVKLSDGSVIVVKHVGTEDEPTLNQRIVNDYLDVCRAARQRIRKKLAALSPDDALELVYGEGWQAVTVPELVDDKETGQMRRLAIGDAIKMAFLRDGEVSRAYSALVRARIIHGVVDGDAAYKRVFEQGGPALLEEAALAVRAYNELGDAEKNG